MVTNLKEGEKVLSYIHILYTLYHVVYTCLQVKCVQYWPDAVGQSQTFGPLNVSLTEELEFADYVVRTIELKVVEIIVLLRNSSY